MSDLDREFVTFIAFWGEMDRPHLMSVRITDPTQQILGELWIESEKIHQDVYSNLAAAIDKAITYISAGVWSRVDNMIAAGMAVDLEEARASLADLIIAKLRISSAHNGLDEVQKPEWAAVGSIPADGQTI